MWTEYYSLGNAYYPSKLYFPHKTFSGHNIERERYWKKTLEFGDNRIGYNYCYGSINPARLAHSHNKSRDCIWFHKSLCLNASRTDFQMIWKQIWWNRGKGVQWIDCCTKASFRALDYSKKQSKILMSTVQFSHTACFYSTQPQHFKQDIFQLKHNGYHSLV